MAVFDPCGRIRAPRWSSYLQEASASCCSGRTSPRGAARPPWRRTRSRPYGRRRSRCSVAGAAGRRWWWWWPPSRSLGCSCWPPPASCRAGSCSAGWFPPETEKKQDRKWVKHHPTDFQLSYFYAHAVFRSTFSFHLTLTNCWQFGSKNIW